MSVVGIIAEYNPFHQGHLYHIESARQLTDASACVCVLSSNFVQRGEPAIVNKWARTKMALNSGADLVIELPSAFSCASAEYFASGAVSIMESLNCIDFLCFGSEEGTLKTLEKTAELLAFESDDFKVLLKNELGKGLSFASARQNVLDVLLPGSRENSLVDKPNNILGIEYIKAMKRIGSSIKPVTVERIGQGYNDVNYAASFSSASAIRQYLLSRFKQDLNLSQDTYFVNNLPKSSLSVLSEELATGRSPVLLEAYETLLFHLLRNTPESELARLPYISEGLENRLKQASLKSVTLDELISAAVTNRYPTARVKRILCALLTGMTSEFLEELRNNGYAQYIKVLGFNETGRKLLSDIRKKAFLPIIVKPASFNKLEASLAIRLFEHEIKVTNTYVLGYPNPHERVGSAELTTSPICTKITSLPHQ